MLALDTTRMDALQPYQMESANDTQWIGEEEVSILASITQTKAKQTLRNALAGQAWRGVKLVVKHNQDGSLAVLIDSLPQDLAALWWQLVGTPEPVAPSAPIPTLTAAPVEQDGQEDTRAALAAWKIHVIRPAIQYPKGSAARAAAMAEIQGREHLDPKGRTVTLSHSTIRNWIRAYELGGLAALGRKPRTDRGAERYVITRTWDRSFVGVLADETVQRINAEWTRYIRSLWASGAPGWRQVADLAQTRLVELTREAGIALPDEMLHAACGRKEDADKGESLSPLRARMEREREFQIVAKAGKDAKRFFDENVPRIRRTRAGLTPMEIVVGDVTPLDIYIDRPEDGKQATVKAVSWLDLATNRLYVSLYLPPAGRGVTRLQIAASFTNMVEHWGLPKTLYIDNGSEYSWAEMMGGFGEISRLTQAMAVALVTDANPDIKGLMAEARKEIVRARPYNAPAKPIEGIFSTLNVVLSMLPGYVGGNRLAKKSANLGKAPESFPGSPENFLDAFAIALNHYHNKPQAGSLKNRSPRAAYQAAIEAGFARTHCPAEVLLLAFADEDTRRVSQGHFVWTAHRGETIHYTHERLWAPPDSQRTVRVRVARHDPRFAFVFPEKGNQLICVAAPDREFQFLDTAGAKEQSKRAGVLRRHVAALRQDCDLLDLVDEMLRSDSHKPAMPTAPIGAEIAPAGELAAMLEAVQLQAQAAIEGAARREPERLSQWNEQRDDPYLAGVVWDDDSNN